MALDINAHSIVMLHNHPSGYTSFSSDDITITQDLENALEMGRSMREHGIPFEMHIFTKGGHGLSLANKEVCCDKDCDAHVGHWVKLCEEWLKMMF